ncbi:T9SS type A sorting domain-containing protein [Winogradskyella flava]|uniref:T9SS type A sorting domain-containing protein n=1 Tax=Winogradskyella flava TaxID=1884876 RepID=A0A842ISD7_9FLAO|nr:T9SS type A sorting domain-containing protein [Winogradskyella flava]MBC2844683.1 T9SS type A sorting domain-containing protein [Winogradskyella flava]
MSALQVQAQNCPELWLEPGVYKLATCGLTTEFYMTIDGTSGELVWAEELAGDDATQLWTVIDHREPASSGYVEITADITPGPGAFTMIVDQSTYDGSGADPEIRVNVRPGLPVSDTNDANYGYDQFQRRKATGWSGAGNNALFAKPVGQGNLRYSVAPTAAGDQVLFQNGGTINDIRFILVEALSTEEFDASSVFISNPVKDELKIEGLNQSIKQISVYDLLGKQVINSNLVDDTTSANLDVSSLNSGLYIVKLEGENGQSLTKKIIKE